MRKLFILIGFLGFSWMAFCQEDGLKLEDLYVDFAIPDISSFSLLGIEDDKITRPGNINKLAVQLKELVPFNTITPGLAVEFSPFLMIKKELDDSLFSLDTYRQSESLRGLQLNFATANDSSGSHFGLGLRWVIFDRSDPLMSEALERDLVDILEDLKIDELVSRAASFNREIDLLRVMIFDSNPNLTRSDQVKIDGWLKTPLRSPTPDKEELPASYTEKSIKDSLSAVYNIQLSEEQNASLIDLIDGYNRIIIGYKGRDAVIASFSAKVAKTKEAWKKQRWNAASAHVSIGTAWASQDSTWGNLSSSKLSFLAGLSLPLQGNDTDKIKGQLIFQALGNVSYDNSNSEQGKFSFGSKLLFGGSDRRVSIEGQYSFLALREEVDGEATMLEDLNVMRGTIGWEMKIVDGLWFEIAGGFRNVDGKSSEITSFSTLKYAFNGKSRFKGN